MTIAESQLICVPINEISEQLPNIFKSSYLIQLSSRIL